MVCILTGHVLKDPDATVRYHTGIDMKAIQDQAPRADPRGNWANRPIPVPDDLDAIIEAIGARADDSIKKVSAANPVDPPGPLAASTGQ